MRYAIILAAVCLVACGNRGTIRRAVDTDTDPPTHYGYRIVASYPHDPTAYTQGLTWDNGGFIESTGEYGRSTLRRVEMETGAVTRSVPLPANVFGEGSTLLDGSIWVLSWHAGVAYTHDPETLERTGQFTYQGEGWGLTTDGQRLYMSDGSPNIAVRDPATFAVRSTIVVRRAGVPVQNINELEWIDGRIWANIYLSNEIVIIDPATGRVEGSIDLGGLSQHLTITPRTDVLNGIAWDSAGGRVFVTGKNWNRLFQIEIFKR